MDNLLSGLVGALVGAVVGAVFAYFASLSIQKKRVKQTNQRLHCLLIVEIADHNSRIARTIDYVLPAWLHRGERRPGKEEDQFLKTLDLPGPQLADSYFKTFLDKLIDSHLLVPLANYYKGVERINSLIKGWEEHKKEEEGLLIDNYIRDCQGLLRASIGAMEDLIKTKGIRYYLTELHKNLIDEFNTQKEWYLYLVELANLRYHHLLALETFLRLKADQSRLANIQEPYQLEKIPKFIKSDPNELWRQYLEAAKEI